VKNFVITEVPQTKLQIMKIMRRVLKRWGIKQCMKNKALTHRWVTRHYKELYQKCRHPQHSTTTC